MEIRPTPRLLHSVSGRRYAHEKDKQGGNGLKIPGMQGLSASWVREGSSSEGEESQGSEWSGLGRAGGGLWGQREGVCVCVCSVARTACNLETVQVQGRRESSPGKVRVSPRAWLLPLPWSTRQPRACLAGTNLSGSHLCLSPFQAGAITHLPAPGLAGIMLGRPSPPGQALPRAVGRNLLASLPVWAWMPPRWSPGTVPCSTPILLPLTDDPG